VVLTHRPLRDNELFQVSSQPEGVYSRLFNVEVGFGSISVDTNRRVNPEVVWQY